MDDPASSSAFTRSLIHPHVSQHYRPAMEVGVTYVVQQPHCSNPRANRSSNSEPPSASTN
eukprot:9483272-Pyramimonas_sp.AAC.1